MRYTKSVVFSHSTLTHSTLLNHLRRWRGLGACTLLAFALLSGSTTATAGVIIDDFSDPNPGASYVIDFLDPDPFLLKQSALNPTHTIGGERDVLVDVLGPVSLVSASGTVGGGSYQFGSAGDSPSMVTLQYDGVDADIPSPPASLVNALGLDNVDLAPGDTNAFGLEFNSVDTAADPTLSFRVTVTGPGGSTEYFGSGATGIPDNTATWNVPFNQFSDPSFNWHDVTSVTVALNELGVKNADFDLKLIQTTHVVPEASTFALLLCGGAVSLVALRRRRAK